jgi:Uncharacterized protein with SCP/PR1 domains
MMNKWFLLLVACFFISSGCEKESGSTEYVSTEENEVIRLVNNERLKAGVAPLEMDLSLMQSCNIRAEELTIQFSHVRPNGTTCFSVIEFASKASGENIARGQVDASSVMSSWMNSEGHRNNILNPNFTHIGVGYTLKNNTAHWVQLFVRK